MSVHAIPMGATRTAHANTGYKAGINTLSMT